MVGPLRRAGRHVRAADLAELVRLPAALTVPGDAWSGAATRPTAPRRAWAMPASSVLLYWSGMALNDWADRTVDATERPERPIPSGAVSPAAALAVFCALIAAGLVLLAGEGSEPFFAGLGLVALIVLYDLWHKGNPVSPVMMAGCRALVYIVAGLAVADSLPGELWGATALLFVYVVGLTQVAKAEGAGVLSGWPVAAVIAPIVYWAIMLPSAWAALLLAVFAAWLGWTLRLLFVRRTIGPAVGGLIAGIALFDALAVASVEGGAAAVAVCLAAFVATIALQTKIAGT